MNLDIQPVILEFLSRRKFLDLPGLGRLFWSMKRARKGTTTAELKPPEFSLEFSPGQSDSAAFVEYLCRQYDITDETAKAWIDSWKVSIEQSIKKKGEYVISGIGTLKRGANGKTLFKPIEDHRIKKSLGLPEFQVTPVTRMVDPKPVTTASTTPEEDENGLLFTILTNFVIPILLLAAILFLSFKIYDQLTSPPGSAADIPVQSDTSKYSASEPGDKDTTPGESDDDKAGLSLADTLNDKNLKEKEIPLGEEQTTLDKYQNRFCIIIVGSFTKAENVAAMIEKVESLGLEVHQEPYGRFTRVGVRFDCYENDLYRKLFQLRGTFSEDAWILKYR